MHCARHLKSYFLLQRSFTPANVQNLHKVLFAQAEAGEVGGGGVGVDGIFNQPGRQKRHKLGNLKSYRLLLRVSAAVQLRGRDVPAVCANHLHTWARIPPLADTINTYGQRCLSYLNFFLILISNYLTSHTMRFQNHLNFTQTHCTEVC